MCGYCCGGVPKDRRGSGHVNCSDECYNALSPRQMRGYVERARKADEALAALQTRLDAVQAVLDECLDPEDGEPWDPTYAMRLCTGVRDAMVNATAVTSTGHR